MPAFIRRENIHHVLRVGAEGQIARDGDSGIERRRVAVDVVRRHQRPVELRRAGWVDDVPDLRPVLTRCSLAPAPRQLRPRASSPKTRQTRTATFGLPYRRKFIFFFSSKDISSSAHGEVNITAAHFLARLLSLLVNFARWYLASRRQRQSPRQGSALSIESSIRVKWQWCDCAM